METEARNETVEIIASRQNCHGLGGIVCLHDLVAFIEKLVGNAQPAVGIAFHQKQERALRQASTNPGRAARVAPMMSMVTRNAHLSCSMATQCRLLRRSLQLPGAAFNRHTAPLTTANSRIARGTRIRGDQTM